MRSYRRTIVSWDGGYMQRSVAAPEEALAPRHMSFEACRAGAALLGRYWDAGDTHAVMWSCRDLPSSSVTHCERGCFAGVSRDVMTMVPRACGAAAAPLRAPTSTRAEPLAMPRASRRCAPRLLGYRSSPALLTQPRLARTVPKTATGACLLVVYMSLHLLTTPSDSCCSPDPEHKRRQAEPQHALRRAVRQRRLPESKIAFAASLPPVQHSALTSG